ncbi:MAG: YqiA/YcfP family alpha/beta fold hydrolase [Gelidibacter sp.]
MKGIEPKHKKDMAIVTEWKQLLRFTMMFFVGVLNVGAQEGRIPYSSELDAQWSRATHINALSPNGKWVIITEEFDNKATIHHLKHTKDTVSFTLPESEWITFSTNGRWFGCIGNKQGVLNIIDLQTNSRRTYPMIQSFHFSKSGNYLAALRKDEDSSTTLLVMSSDGTHTTSISGVSAYMWNPDNNKLAVIVKENSLNKVLIYDMLFDRHKVIKEIEGSTYGQLKWSGSGNALVFTEQRQADSYIHYYRLNDVTKTIDYTRLNQKFPDFKIKTSSLFLSDDGKKLLFYRQKNTPKFNEVKSTPEIWRSEDPWPYPKMKMYEQRETSQLLTAWYSDTDELTAIETREYPSAALDVNHKYALVFDQTIYEPLYKQFPNTDIHVRDMASGQTHLGVKNQYTESGFASISPNGRYLTFFKDKHWWVHDMATKKTVNLTHDMKASFENKESDRAGDVFPYGSPGWTSDDKSIILYDKFDIWQLSPDGHLKKRITKGRENKIQYRINKDYRRNSYYFLTVNVSFSSSPFNLEKGVILEMYDPKSHASGYALWKAQDSIKTLLFENRKIDDILVSEAFDMVIYRKQKYNEPPSIHILDIKSREQHLIFQSNPKLMQFELGKGERIEYITKEDTLSGSLIYPANFNSQDKYPMIVNIYEKQSKQINTFYPPSYYETIGFNTLTYAINDYFVYYPDIAYKKGNPGVSALNCVTAAIDKAIASGFIDRDRIGLIGHSFGGYESAFIATQSNRFAAVVAGAPVTDFTSHYHSMGWNWNKPEMWRYENQQWRMGDSYYNIKEVYMQNSPIEHVENVTTPLLLWTGKKDYQVYWQQSIEMFLALKRLGKQSQLVLFEDEGHALSDTTNKLQLSREIMNWFEKYLK